MKEKIRYGVVGSGALGGYYGAKLAHAGCDVHFLMRSDLETVRRDGLTVRSKDGDFHLANVQAHGDPAGMGPCDVVLIALKTTGNASLPALIPPLLGPETSLVTLQNGLGNEELLASHFGARRVMGGLCFVCLNRVAPGVIEHYGHGTLSVGEFKGPPQDRTMRLVTDFQKAGIDAKAVQSLITERWRKLVWNIPFNGLGIAAAANVGEVLNDEHLHAEACALMAETIAAAGAQGYAIRPDFIDFQIQRSWPMGPYRSSSQIDYEAGREVEVESIWGEPLRQAKSAGAATPRLEMLCALLRHLVAKRKP
ncbi:MAG TPA: 2-dehydropantoate 2-reductase [Chthoniobacteraceae bacterium]|nr:2-dehydropantoate 2-reductase [Chthoniobacteraceae bacterium]